MAHWKWTARIAPLIVVAVGGVLASGPAVEHLLADRIAPLAQAHRLVAEVRGRDVTLRPASEQPNGDVALWTRGADAVAQAPGVRLATLAAPPGGAPVLRPAEPVPAEPRPAEPLKLEIERTPGGMVVSGRAPSAPARDAFLAALRTAAAPGTVSGDLVPAADVPVGVDFELASRFAAVQAARLSGGRVVIVGDRLSLEGQTADVAALKALMDALRPPLPGGLRLGQVAVKPAPAVMRPFVFAAERTPGGVVLTGGAPSPEAHALLRDMVREIAGAAVTDRVSVAAGAHDDFPSFVAFGFTALTHLAKGRFTITDATFALEGEAVDAASFAALQSALATAPMGLTVQPPAVRSPPLQALPPETAPASSDPAAAVASDPPVSCDALEAARVVAPFARGSAQPAAPMKDEVEDIVRVVRACPGVVVEVSGHTDAVGGRRANLRMSQARARAVERLLRAEGVPRARIAVLSYANDRPVIRGARTAQDHALNRRVEIVLRRGGLS